jgi:DNA-directed RNA polymerase specialized sigma24 family protein
MPESDRGARRPAEGVRPPAEALDHAPVAEFGVFYRTTITSLVRFLVMQGATLVDAAEIAQDTLSSVYTRWCGLNNPRAWSFRVASKAWIRKMSSVREDLTADLAAPSPLLRAVPADAWHVRHELITALGMLPPRQRQVMAWTFSGYTPAEIATELQLPNEQVRANLRLARRALAARLTDGQDTA